MTQIKTRFAPSPTGYLHVGGARTALFNYLFARSNGGKFVLRIEDTDQQRSSEEATKQVLESLQWLGIDWDEGPGKENEENFYQSKRLAIYQKYFDKLLEEKKIYRCFCSDEELTEKKNRSKALGTPHTYDGKCRSLSEKEIQQKLSDNIPYTYRFKVEKKNIIFEDLVKGKVQFDSSLIGDFVVRKSDGFPTYNFAVVVDDFLMGINHVLRGDDHISNTPRQILIYEGLGFELPKFAHISMILGANREKLSKRHGATDLLEFKKAGYYADTILNHLALLGWSPEDDNEVISREKLKQSFISTKFSSAPAVFDYAKLDYFNGLYIRNLPIEKLLEDVKNHFTEKNQWQDLSEKMLGKEKEVLILLKDYCKKLDDLPSLIIDLFNDEFEVSHEMANSQDAKKIYSLANKIFSEKTDEYIDLAEYKDLISKSKTELNIKGKNFFLPLRIKLTGKEHGIEMESFFQLISRQSILKRLAE